MKSHHCPYFSVLNKDELFAAVAMISHKRIPYNLEIECRIVLSRTAAISSNCGPSVAKPNYGMCIYKLPNLENLQRLSIYSIHKYYIHDMHSSRSFTSHSTLYMYPTPLSNKRSYFYFTIFLFVIVDHTPSFLLCSYGNL